MPRSPDDLARVGLIVVALGVALVVLAPLANAARAAWHLAAARRIAAEIVTSPTGASRLPELRRELAAGRSGVGAARDQIAPLSSLPLVGGAAGQASTLLEIGDALLAAGLPVIDVLGEVRDAGAGAGGQAEAIEALARQRDRVFEAEAEVARAERALAQIDRAALRGPLAPLGTLVDRIDARLPDARAGLAVLRLLPALGGGDRPVTYILIAQNEEERRATGGFIGSLGAVRVERGRVVKLDLRYAYDFDDRRLQLLPPPEPLAELMGFGAWHIRDANWFPDFPTSARWIEWFWHREFGEWPDGVIALDEHAFQAAIGAVGAIEMPAFGETITAENYRERTHHWLYPPTMDPNRPDVGQRSSFMRELGAGLAGRLLGLKADDMVRLAPTLERLLQEKHVLLHFEDPAAAELVRGRGWDGHVDRAAPDFLMVVDTTVSNTKLAPFVDQSVEYELALRPDGGGRARVSVRYVNRYRRELAPASYPRQYLGDFWNPLTRQMDYREGRYATYVRVLAPAGASGTVVTGADGAVSVERQSERAVVGAYLALEAGQSRALEIVYDLPAPLLDAGGRYRLKVQKQPGTDAVPLTVRVTAPAGRALERAGAAPAPSVTIETDLREDRTIELDGSPAAEPVG
jgi:hypothetical protein